MTTQTAFVYRISMNLNIPQHVIDGMRSRGVTGNSNEWTFKVAQLSGVRAFIWFSSNDGYVVEGSSWNEACMALAVKTPEDTKILSGVALPLGALVKDTTAVIVYPDGSLSFFYKKCLEICSWKNGKASSQVTLWIEGLSASSNKFWIKLTKRSDLYKNIAATLEKLKDKLNKV